MSWPWKELGLDGPASLEEVRRAYAQRVKEVHPEEDPEGFQRLHTAYQQARKEARQAGRAGRPVPGAAQAPQPRPAPPEPRQAQGDRLDFTELLRQEPAEERAPEAGEPALDFDTLLHQEESPQEPREEKREATWDFQRLFREEDAWRTDQMQPGGGQDTVVNRALELVELLLEEECPCRDWERFLTSVVFFRVKWNPRFMAGLAGAFRAEPGLDGKIREIVCRAYRLRPGRVPREHEAFYAAISGKEEQTLRKERRFRRKHPALFLLLLVVGGILLIRVAAGVGIYLYELPDRQMAAELCQYIQEDYGYPVESQYAGHLTSAELFYLPVQQRSFTAWPEGERDLSKGQLGYGTDLGSRFLTEALEDFAGAWSGACELELMNAEGGALSTGEQPAIYSISTSLEGGTDCLAALGEEMDRLSGESWYRLWQPDFQIQLEVWNAPYFTYRSADGPFPAEEILSRYQEEVPVELVTYLVEECGLAELDFGGRAFHMEDLGTITLHDDTYVLVGGVEEATGQTTRLYLYNSIYLISVAAADFDPDISYIDYALLLMGEKIPQPGDDLPWPRVGICRD